ncbi:MAG TPA: AAA family ATPase [Steroidobacteraceae bacterium]|nr:AAA family ATPase [Steroidobacteraceae bacterium]
MYTRFFGLNEKPFAITPDPRYLYMSEKHAEALAHLMYGLNEAGGFIQLTGEVGTGKTTVIRTLLEQLPQHADVALILNPNLNPQEFLQAIVHELGIKAESLTGSKQLIDALNAHLLDKHAKGRRVVVIVDEAQNLSPETLEQVRMLTNLETATTKLLQIILIGQPELRDVLARSDLRQLAQRITGRYHLAPLSRDDTAAYVWHRMRVAGTNIEIFTDAALREVHRLSGGVPRLINIICDRALLGAYTLEEHEIGPRLIREAASEVAGHWRTKSWWRWLKWSPVVAIAIAAVSFTAYALRPVKPAAPAVVVNTPEKVEPIKPVTLDVGDVLQHATGSVDTDAAFAALFDLWHVKFNPAAGTACEQVTLVGLECVYQKGAWAQLVALNRPAILQLNDDHGVAHQVVLSRVLDHDATITIGNDRYDVSIASLARYWNGDYLVIWKPQVTGQRTLNMGMRSNDVAWLRSTLLATKNDQSASSSSAETKPESGRARNLFDENLLQQVIEFQRSHHLEADGVAGVQTQVALDAMLNVNHGPVLSSSPNS